LSDNVVDAATLKQINDKLDANKVLAASPRPSLPVAL